MPQIIFAELLNKMMKTFYLISTSMSSLSTVNGSQGPTEKLDKNSIALVLKLQTHVDLDARPVFVQTIGTLGLS